MGDRLYKWRVPGSCTQLFFAYCIRSAPTPGAVFAIFILKPSELKSPEVHENKGWPIGWDPAYGESPIQGALYGDALYWDRRYPIFGRSLYRGSPI